MSPIYALFALAFVVAQFIVPQRIGFAPLVLAACVMPDLVVLDVGVAFTLTKLLILAGLIRALSSGTFAWSARNPLDVLFAAWAVWAILSSFAHHPKDHNPITVQFSMVYDLLGTYLYARSYLANQENILGFSKLLLTCTMLLAGLMAFERSTTLNIPWTVMTGSPAHALSREGRVRAGGPFKHPILAGTVGATSGVLLAFMAFGDRRKAIKVMLASGLVVFSSASSGPVMTLAAGIGALMLWRWRTRLRFIRTMAILTIVGLHIVMKAPVWYLMARIDLAGGSTGWHRAELITQALEHLDRWWMFGTDYTRDWMPYGIGWSTTMVDITNLYIQMGVRGGLLLMLLFIAILLKTFQLLGRKMLALRHAGDPREFMLWCFGAALFAHCITFLSVTYFDQSYLFYCLLIGTTPGLCTISERHIAGGFSSTDDENEFVSDYDIQAEPTEYPAWPEEDAGDTMDENRRETTEL